MVICKNDGNSQASRERRREIIIIIIIVQRHHIRLFESALTCNANLHYQILLAVNRTFYLKKAIGRLIEIR